MKLKLYILFILINLSFGIASAQDLSRTVISSAGEYRRSDFFHISFTVGEAAIFNKQVDGFYWKSGFQQGYKGTGVGIPSREINVVSFELFPNPGNGENLFLRFPTAQKFSSEIEVAIYALGSGNIVSTTILHPDPVTVDFGLSNLTNITSGLYLVVLKDHRGVLGSRPWIKF